MNKKSSSSKPQYDVIVVGAGPAGAVLSYLLGRSGIDVLLIERDTSFKREFRGPAYQPSIVKYFDQMGILDEILLVDHSKMYEFKITDNEKPLITLGLNILDKPYNYALAMQQGPFLRKIIQLASEFPNLTFLGNTPAADLAFDNGMVSGVKVQIDNEEQMISSRLVVAADGRFSTLRSAAGIELHKSKDQFDVVWFDLPISQAEKYQLGLEISQHGMVVFIPQEKGHIRVGWILPKGEYPELKQGGIDAFCKRLIETKPILKDILPQVLLSFDQCSYLDVKIAIAKQWAKDGLLLIGDAAHIASPIGAQGNKLAIQDAVCAHPLIVQTLKSHHGIVRSYHLKEFVTKRKTEAKKIFRMQRLLGKAIFSIHNPILEKIRGLIFPFVQKYVTPKIMKMMAMGTQKLDVDCSSFQYQSDYGKLHRYYMLKVAKVLEETQEAASFYFEIPHHLKHEFSYKPGQFITLRLLDDGQLHKRCYSLSSDPGEDKHLRITVKRIKNGLISNDLIDQLKENDEVLVLPPAGQFIAKPDAAHHVMFAGGSGITPIMSLIRTLLKKPYVEQVKLIFANHDSSSIIFGNDLEKLQEAFSQKFAVIHSLSVNNSSRKNVIGRLDAEKVNEILDTCPPNAEYYLCGPQGLLSLVKETLKKKNISEKNIHVETFTSLAEPFEEVHGAAAAEPLIVGEGKEAENTETKAITVKIDGRETQISCHAGESILDAAIRENLNPPFSCREGICSTCIAQLDSGKIVMNKHQALSDSEAEMGKILTCQATPLTPHCRVDYD